MVHIISFYKTCKKSFPGNPVAVRGRPNGCFYVFFFFYLSHKIFSQTTEGPAFLSQRYHEQNVNYFSSHGKTVNTSSLVRSDRTLIMLRVSKSERQWANSPFICVMNWSRLCYNSAELGSAETASTLNLMA